MIGRFKFQVERAGGEKPGKSDDFGSGTFPRSPVVDQGKTPITLGAVEAAPSAARAGRSPEVEADPGVIGRGCGDAEASRSDTCDEECGRLPSMRRPGGESV